MDDNSQDLKHEHAFAGALKPGEKTALLVIDLVLAYLDPSSPLYLPGTGQAAYESNLRLVKAARASGAPIILTNVEYDEAGTNGGYFYKKVPALASFTKGNKLGGFPDGLVAPIDLVVTKQYPSAFFGTSLAPTLRALGVDTVMITGFSTSGCVRATAVDAIQHGFIPIVVEDACADRGDSQHRANLYDIAAKYGEVVSEASALSILSA